MLGVTHTLECSCQSVSPTISYSAELATQAFKDEASSSDSKRDRCCDHLRLTLTQVYTMYSVYIYVWQVLVILSLFAVN